MEIAANEQCATHHYNLGLALLSKRDFVGAEEALLNAVRNSPHLAEAYVQLGGICLERGDLEGCLRYNEEAAQCRAKFPVPWSNIAFVHLQRGEPDKAITALKKALKWDPDFVQAKNALTTAYYMQGDFEACEKLCKEILEKEPAFAPGSTLASTPKPASPPPRPPSWALKCPRASWKSSRPRASSIRRAPSLP